VFDDEVQRAGMAAVLGDRPDVGAVEEESIASALARSGWAGIDVVVLDPFRPDPVGDQLAGVAVIEKVRRAEVPRPPAVVAVAGIAADDALRLRAREAGATGYVHRWWVPDATELCAEVLNAAVDGAGVPPVADRDAVDRLGITSRSRINSAVAAAWEEVLVPEAGWVGPRGRSREARRARFNAAARLRPVAGDGLEPERDQTLPSIRQVQRVVAWATRPVPVLPTRPPRPEEAP
jgi:DNA-binding NarL/FixJ family response regulator